MRFTRKFYIILMVLIIIIATIIVLIRIRNTSVQKVQTESSKESQLINSSFVENNIFKELESLSRLDKKTKVVNSRAIEMYYLDSSKISGIDVRQAR